MRGFCVFAVLAVSVHFSLALRNDAAERVHVRVLREHHVSRFARAVDDVSNMPDSMALKVEGHNLSPAVLRLKRHSLLSPTLASQGKRTSRLVDSAVYTDLSRSAAMIVRRSTDGQYLLDGSFVHEDQEFLISPVSRSRRAPRRRMNHRVVSSSAGDDAISFVGDELPDIHRGEGRRGQQQRGQQGQGRGRPAGRGKRQAVVQHVVETAIIVDYSDYSRWLANFGASAVDELTLYYTFVAESVGIRYSAVNDVDSSLNIGFAVTELVVLDLATDSAFIGDLVTSNDVLNGSAALGAFFSWLPSRTDISTADHYMLFTAYNLTIGPGDIAGIAYKGTVCTAAGLSVTENRNSGITAGVAAHELGHSLSADHDVDVGCDDTQQYIMTTSLRVPVSSADKSNPWKFSTCSVNSFKTYLEGVTCTLPGETTGSTALPSADQRAGQVLSRDEQCFRHFLDNSSTFCENLQASSQVGGLDTLCYGMLCSRPDTPNTCTYILPQEYTPCGTDKWCEKGVCVDIPTTAAPTTTTTVPTTTTTTEPPTTTTTTTTTTPPTTTTTTPTTTTTTPTTTTTTTTTTTPPPTTTTTTTTPTTTTTTEPTTTTSTTTTTTTRPTTTTTTTQPPTTTTTTPKPATTTTTRPPTTTTPAPTPEPTTTTPPETTTTTTQRPTTTSTTQPPRPSPTTQRDTTTTRQDQRDTTTTNPDQGGTTVRPDQAGETTERPDLGGETTRKPKKYWPKKAWRESWKERMERLREERKKQKEEEEKEKEKEDRQKPPQKQHTNRQPPRYQPRPQQNNSSPQQPENRPTQSSSSTDQTQQQKDERKKTTPKPKPLGSYFWSRWSWWGGR